MKHLLVLVAISLFCLPSFALNIQKKVERAYLKAGGSKKALNHLKCFLNNYAEENFSLRSAGLSERCNNMAYGKTTVNINSQDHVVIVDYSLPSSERRLFILDLENPKPPYVEKFYVAHGKYQAPSYNNTKKAKNHNTVNEIDYYSNVSGSKASSSGFYITGHIYQGRWTGPKGDKFSLIIHGINKSRNDNACDRAIVLHGNTYVKESGPDEGVRRMSAGCYMVDYDYVNQIIDAIRGGGGTHHKKEHRLGGVLFFNYGKREEGLSSSYYCSSESEKSLRLK